jgi:preprotein translocase subunit YajC
MTLVMNTRFRTKFRSLVLSLGLLAASSTVCLAEGPAVPAGSQPPAATSGAPAQQPGGLMAFAPFILMFVVLYFLVLRPQQKKMKEQQSMITALKHGDEIITNSGLLGKVTGITDKVVTVEVADNVRVKMLKSQVSQVIKGSIKDLAQ